LIKDETGNPEPDPAWVGRVGRQKPLLAEQSASTQPWLAQGGKKCFKMKEIALCGVIYCSTLVFIK
jgi:hypothetical protein